MIYFFKNYKPLLALFITLFIFLKNSNVFANYIRDTEIEFTIDSWSRPIFEAANINPNEIKIHIIADKKINAFVIDGNNMFINTGLITKAGSASGVIGVIAHETGHIAAGHILKLKEKIKDLPILVNDTNNVIKFNNSLDNGITEEKKRSFWDLLKTR